MRNQEDFNEKEYKLEELSITITRGHHTLDGVHRM
jgi:hypothetical protein